LPQPTEDENITGAVKEQLHEMGIYARDLTTAEIVDRAIGRVRYIEVPDDKANLDPEDLQIAAQRIPLKIAEDVLKARYAILGIGPMPTDSRKNEDAWKEEAKKRKAQIRKDLEDAFNDYLTASGKKARDANAADFATFIEHDYDKYANIVNVLDLIRSTSVAAQKKIALTEAQAQSCQDALVAGLLPDKSAGKTVRNYLFPEQTAKTAGQKITPKNEENQETPQQQPAPAPAADGTSASAVPASATSPGAEAR
jgi:hypothetical protein